MTFHKHKGTKFTARQSRSKIHLSQSREVAKSAEELLCAAWRHCGFARKTFLLFLTLGSQSIQAQTNDHPLALAAAEQQRTISHLVYAKKMAKRVECENPGEKEQDPFKDEQDFEFSSVKKELQELRQKQESIIETLEKPTEPNVTDLTPEQADIASRLDELQQYENLGITLPPLLESAEEASRKAVQALELEAFREALLSGHKTLAKIELAIKALTKQSEEQTQESIEKAEQSINEAARCSRKGAGKQAQKETEQTKEALEEAAEKQEKQGNEEAAEQLNKLAQCIDDSGLAKSLRKSPFSTSTSNQLADVRGALAQALQGNKSAETLLKEATDALAERAAEFKYIIAGKKTDANSLAQGLRETEVLFQRIDSALSQLQSNESQSPGLNPQMLESIDGLIVGMQEGDGAVLPIGTAQQAYLLATEVLEQAREELRQHLKNLKLRDIAREEVPEKYQADVAAYFEQLSLNSGNTKAAHLSSP